MARNNISPQAIRAMLSEQSEEVFLMTCEITGVGFSPIYLVNNFEDVLIRPAGKFLDHVYHAFPFDIILPNESKDKPPQARIRLDNLDPEIINAIRIANGKPTFTLAIRLASDIQTIEVGPITLQSSGADWDENWVELILTSKNILNEPYPFRTFTPVLYPGLFQ